MCAEGVDAVEQSGSGLLRSLPVRTQGSYPSGLESRDEEISAMLQNNHANISHQAALMGVMSLPSNNPDPLNSFRMPYSTFQGGYNNNNNISADFSSRATIRAPQAGGEATTLAQQSWATDYNNGVQQQQGDNRSSHWGHVEPVKSEILEMSPNHQAFDPSGVYESPVTSFTGMLQRYHSAPSSFLQSLSELNEDGGAGGRNRFTQASNNAMGSLFPPDRRLTPITEQMDVERMAGSGGLSMHDFEHFLGASDQGEFGPPQSTTLSALGKKESDTGNAFSASQETSVLRPKRPPAVSLELINKATKDRHDTNASAEDSSSATSEENSLDAGLKAMCAPDEYFRGNLASWKSPTSPAGGKRLRGLAGDSDTSSGSAEAPPVPCRNGQFGNIRRHMSLPSARDGPTSLSVEEQAALGTVQMRARAKRGCATHPRSIAERVRRTRISERMKKLQDLVPNMDKQTNTADMLDETVEYVKSLQLHLAELSETVAKLRAAQQ